MKKTSKKKENSKKDQKDEIRVLSADDDDKIKVVGEVLANESSRAILRMLSGSNEMTINQISQEMGLSIPLVSHHLKKMQETGVVKVSRIGRSVKGQEMKYYSTTNQSFLITPPERQIHSIFNSLKKFSKFAAIGMAGLVSWAMLKPTSDIQTKPAPESRFDDFTDTKLENESEEWISATEPRSATKPEVAEPTGATVSAPQQEPRPEPEPEPRPEPEPESSQAVEQFDLKIDSDSATGSISLDRTDYPEQFATTSAADSVDPVIFSIIIPIAVIAGGIIIERILTKWFSKRKVSMRQE